jgi:hypothetical protein
MSFTESAKRRRQDYLDEQSYQNTLDRLHLERVELRDRLSIEGLTLRGYSGTKGMLAWREFYIFELKFTAGEKLSVLADSLGDIVTAFEEYKRALDQDPDTNGDSPFQIDNDTIDDYVSYLNLISSCILLGRAELVDRVAMLLNGTDLFGEDEVIDELLKFFLPSYKVTDEWFWEKPHTLLLEAIESTDRDKAAKVMKSYVKKWYLSMKGQASFWGKHEQTKPEYTIYRGYWDMCAAAFTYLYGLDDTSYRNEIIYPREMVDFARSLPHRENADQTTLSQLRVIAGNPCTRSGFWFTAPRQDSRSKFQEGDIMPTVAHSDYGLTIWQWDAQQ